MGKTKSVRNPWKRDRKGAGFGSSDGSDYSRDYLFKRPKFGRFPENTNLDIDTKRCAFKASPSVVSILSFSGDEPIFEASGAIIESDNDSAIVLTAAVAIRYPDNETAVADNIKVVVYLVDGISCTGQIVAYDFHYNLAAIKIQSDIPLPAAILRRLDDSMSIHPSELSAHQGRPFQLLPHSNSFKLVPGDTVLSLGRYFAKPYELMVAPGSFSIDHCEGFDCKELFRSDGRITQCGTGGPVINLCGEVIGVSIRGGSFTPFIPINVACKWWEHYKSHGTPHRPCLGMELTNLYAAEVGLLEKIIQKFPTISKGIVVEEVCLNSSAEFAGIRPNDVIVQCNGNAVQSLLELFEIMWDKADETLELVVIRPSNDTTLLVAVDVVETTSDKFYSWPCWGHSF